MAEPIAPLGAGTTVTDGPAIVAKKALLELASALAAAGSPYLPALNPKRRELLLFEPEGSPTDPPVMTIGFRRTEYVWGDPQRSFTRDEVDEAAKEIAYVLVSGG